MPWVEIAEAAFTLGVSERTIRNWIKSGKLEARTMNGRREVNIPEAEDAQQAHAFGSDDDNGDGAPIDTQKRLEVALIECGRVKGTLASQERMMETLSANIAELNTKLQKSERTISSRTLWCVGIAFIGVMAVMSVRFFDDAKLSEREKDFLRTEKEMSESYSTKLEAKEDEYDSKLDQLRKSHASAVEQLKTDMNKRRLEAITEVKAELEQRHARELERIQKELAKAQDERDKLRDELSTARAELKLKEKELQLQETRLSELEQTRRELEAQVVKLKTEG